jgi:hypothetical protein
MNDAPFVEAAAAYAEYRKPGRDLRVRKDEK